LSTRCERASKRRAAAFAVLALALGACQEGPRVGSPHWGRDVCERCRMTLSTPEHAAQLVGPGARVSFFDDLGCAIADRADHAERVDSTLYVLRPGSREEWVPARALRFRDGERTPMDYGVVADAQGELSFAEAEARLLERARSGRSPR